MDEKAPTVFVDLYSVPDDWREKLVSLNLKYDRWEPQPLADQIKLHKCANIPKELPSWLRKA